MSQHFPDPAPAKPDSQMTPSSPRNEILDEGLWINSKDIGNREVHEPKKYRQSFDDGCAETVLSPPPNRGQGAFTKKPLIATLFGVTEAASSDISTPEDFEKAPAELSSSFHKLDLGNIKIHKVHTNASTTQRDLVPKQSSNMQHSKTPKLPTGMLETSHNVTAGSPLENMTEEDRLKWGEGEGIDINDLLSHIDKSVSKDDTEETVFDKRIVDNGIDKLPSQKRCISLNVLADQIEDVGGMDANDDLPPWTKTSSGSTGGPSAMDTTHSSEEDFSNSSVQLSGGPAGSSGLENMTEEDRLQWGQGEGINMNDLVSYFDKAFSEDDAEETFSDNKTSDDGFDKRPNHKRCTSSNIPCDQSDDIGGMDVNHGLQPWTNNSSGVTGGPSVEDATYSAEGHLSPSSIPFSGLRPTPSRGGGVDSSRPVSLSAVGQAVTRGDYIPADAQPDIQVGSVAVAENDRNKSMDDAEKWSTDAYFWLNDGARKITNEDRITLGLHDGWPYKLSDANTGLPPMTEESWRVMETKQTVRRVASDGQSEVDTGSVTAENHLTNTEPPRPIVANVHRLRNMELDEPFKLFEPPEPKPMQQEEAASDMVEASGHNSAQLSAIPFYAANSKTETHSVVDTAAHPTGAPEMNDTASLMKDTAKDMPANFGLQKWTGDDSVEPDIKDAKLVSSDSARPESSSASQDVSFMLWSACYPDDPDKVRELEASTGVPGIRVHSVDVLFRATSNPQDLDEVDASQNSDNFRTEMETQVSPSRLSNE